MPVELPPSPPAIIRSFQQEQSPLQIPQTDITVEVVATAPIRTKLEEVTRLLGRRQQARTVNRTYLPVILEMITLVESNPIRPIGRAWLSVTALTIGYDAARREVIMEYCIDNCQLDPQTGMAHPRRKMITYRAPEKKVEERLNKKLDKLKKFAEPRVAK